MNISTIGENQYLSLDSDLYFRTCTRCEGSGHYSFDGNTTICFRCSGDRVDPNSPRFTRAEAETDSTKRTKARERAAEKREAKRLAEIAKRDEAVAALRAAHPLTIEFLETCDRSRNSFLEDMHAAVFTALPARPITEKMLSAIESARLKAEAEAARPKNQCPEGKTEITGEITSVKMRETQWGYSFKAVIADSRGFRVWGTLPAGIITALEAAAGDFNWAEYALGKMISLTATIARSDDDEEFGFYSRPSKAKLVAA